MLYFILIHIFNSLILSYIWNNRLLQKEIEEQRVKTPISKETCDIKLVESIPEGLDFPNSHIPANPSTYSAFLQLLNVTESSLELASSYWSPLLQITPQIIAVSIVNCVLIAHREARKWRIAVLSIRNLLSLRSNYMKTETGQNGVASYMCINKI